jgi:hypothetical protein
MTTASLFTAGGGIMSVGLFQYDMSCLLNVCASQYSHTVNKWCHFINSEFDGWAIGAYISAPAHPVAWTGTPPVHPTPVAARKVAIYGGAATAAPWTAVTDIESTYSFYGIGFHHENMGDTFVAVSYSGYYNVCKGRCSNSYT